MQPNAYHLLHAELAELIAATRERRPVDPSRVPAIAQQVMHIEKWMLRDKANYARRKLYPSRMKLR